MSSANRGSLFLPLQTVPFLFPVPSLLQCLELLVPYEVLGKNGHPCHIPDVRGKSFSPVPSNMMLTVLLCGCFVTMLLCV